MQTAMHGARLVAAHSALLALLVEHIDDLPPKSPNRPDGITVFLSYDGDMSGLDITFTAGGVPVAGEGI